MEKPKIKQPMYKYEIAALCGVSSNTLRRWLNYKYYDKLTALDYKKTQKHLTPEQVIFLNDILDFL